MDQLLQIPIESLVETSMPLRPVRKVSVEYQELVDSIRDRGILQPLLVRPCGDKYEVVEGSYRRAAARECGLSHVPCLVRDMTDNDVLSIQLQTNAIRPTTQKVEFADRIFQIMEERSLTLPQLATMLHKSVPWLREILKLRKLSGKAREMANRGELCVRAGVALARLPPRMQSEYFQLVHTMSTEEFVETCRQGLKNFREFVKNGRAEISLLRLSETVPWLRQMSELRHEAATCEKAGSVIASMGGTTPIDGWRACLAWLLHVDPESISKQLDKQESARYEKLTAEARRKADRELKNHLIKLRAQDNEQ